MLCFKKALAKGRTLRQHTVYGTRRGRDEAAKTAVAQEAKQLHFARAAEFFNQLVEVLGQDQQRAIANKFLDQIKGGAFGILKLERINSGHALLCLRGFCALG